MPEKRSKIEPVKYPEHEKLHKIAAQSQACGEFIEWLRQHKQLSLCVAHHHGDDCWHRPANPRARPTLVCAMSEGEMIPTIAPMTDLLAEFFEIDEKKIETEKRQMLEELRNAAKRR